MNYDDYCHPSLYFSRCKAYDLPLLDLSEDVDGVEVNHPLYNENIHCWKMMRDSVEGQDAIRRNAIEMDYLQIPPGIAEESKIKYKYYSGKNSAEYHYINKAHYIEIVPRILDEVEGRIFSKPYKLEYPEGLDIDKIDCEGLTFDEYARWCVREVFSVSRFGVLTDWNEKKDAPVIKRYVAESIVNWDTDEFGELTLVVLEDEVKEKGQVFSHNKIKRRIVLMKEIGADGEYVITQRTFYKDDESGEFYEGKPPLTLQRRGFSLQKIPFTFFGGIKPKKPMLKPLAAAAIAYFDANASYRNAMWWASNEQPYFTFEEDGGFIKSDGQPYTEKDGELEIIFGSSSPILLKNGDLKYASVKGVSLDHARRRLTDLKAEMTGMGARSFNAQTASNIKVQTERMQQRAEGSVIGSIAHSISKGIMNSLNIAIEWADLSGSAVFELNKDYTDDFDIKYMSQLIDSIDADVLSERRVFEYLKDNSDLIPDSLTFEQHQLEKQESRTNNLSFNEVDFSDLDNEDGVDGED